METIWNCRVKKGLFCESFRLVLLNLVINPLQLVADLSVDAIFVLARATLTPTDYADQQRVAVFLDEQGAAAIAAA